MPNLDAIRRRAGVGLQFKSGTPLPTPAPKPTTQNLIDKQRLQEAVWQKALEEAQQKAKEEEQRASDAAALAAAWQKANAMAHQMALSEQQKQQFVKEQLAKEQLEKEQLAKDQQQQQQFVKEQLAKEQLEKEQLEKDQQQQQQQQQQKPVIKLIQTPGIKPTKSTFVGITTIANISEKVAAALEKNLKFFKKIYVVVDVNDSISREKVSVYPNVELLLSSATHINGARYNIAGMINEGQKKAHNENPTDWIAIFEPDTMLPDNFWEMIEKEQIYSNYLYTIPRKIYRTFLLMEKDVVLQEQGSCGFFQLYYDKTKYYPAWSDWTGDCNNIFEGAFDSKLEMITGYCKACIWLEEKKRTI